MTCGLVFIVSASNSYGTNVSACVLNPSEATINLHQNPSGNIYLYPLFGADKRKLIIQFSSEQERTQRVKKTKGRPKTKKTKTKKPPKNRN